MQILIKKWLKPKEYLICAASDRPSAFLYTITLIKKHKIKKTKFIFNWLFLSINTNKVKIPLNKIDINPFVEIVSPPKRELDKYNYLKKVLFLLLLKNFHKIRIIPP